MAHAIQVAAIAHLPGVPGCRPGLLAYSLNSRVPGPHSSCQSWPKAAFLGPSGLLGPCCPAAFPKGCLTLGQSQGGGPQACGGTCPFPGRPRRCPLRSEDDFSPRIQQWSQEQCLRVRPTVGSLRAVKCWAGLSLPAPGIPFLECAVRAAPPVLQKRKQARGS